jgi:hypothetical protein
MLAPLELGAHDKERLWGRDPHLDVTIVQPDRQPQLLPAVRHQQVLALPPPDDQH